jgi:WD40 repeat protein
MIHSLRCPEPELLARLLAGTLKEKEQRELTAHLDHCPRCRAELERLASGEEAWKETARRFGEQANRESESILQEVLARLRKSGTGEQTRAESEKSADDPLSFLRFNQGWGKHLSEDINRVIGDAMKSVDEALAFLRPPREPEKFGNLAHYEVMQDIGHGGMGVVLKAFDPRLHRVVAIKVMAPALANNGSARQRFEREARAAAAVRNEHVIDIYAVGEENGLSYLVMEYIAGRSLQERIDQSGPMELKEILRIGLQTANGLAAAHAQGLIHRDIKPANILLENGVERVKITDFGLARAVDDASLTQSGVITGTPQYMSPEQARGETIDHRTDLFSLGSVLYAMCAGRPPFRASTTMGMLRLVSDETPRPIREINPEISERLAEIIAQLQAKDPAARFQSAAEVAAALEQHLAEVQQPGWNAVDPPVEQSCKPDDRIQESQRSRWRVVGAVGALLLLGLGMAEATGVTQVVPTVIRIARGDGTLVVEIEGPEIQVTIEGEGEELIFRGAGIQEIRLCPGAYKLKTRGEGNPVLSVEEFTITRGGKCIVRITNEAAKGAVDAGRILPSGPPVPDHEVVPATLRRRQPATVTINPEPLPEIAAGAPLNDLALVGRPATLPGIRSWTIETRHHRAPVENVAYSPDGRWLATACIGGAVRIWEAKTQRLVRILVVPKTTSAEWLRGLAWSPDSRYLATSQQNAAVELWEVETGRRLRTLRSPGPIRTVAWSPDGRSLAGSGWFQNAVIWDVAAGELRRLLTGHTDSIQGLAWSPDSQKLASGSDDKTARIWDAETGQSLGTLKGHTGPVKAVAFSPYDGGLHLATASYDRTVRIWNAKEGICIYKLVGHSGEVWAVEWSPDGKRLASGCTDSQVILWDADAGKQIRLLVGHKHIVASLSWSPDGQTLASGSCDTTVALWSVGKRPGSTIPGVTQWSNNFPLWSPNGKYMVTGAKNARLWSAETGEQLHSFPEHLGIARAWSPDSKLLVTTDWKGGLWLWDSEERSLRSSVSPHDKVMRAAAWSPDGKTLATGDESGNVALWGGTEDDWKKGQSPKWMYLTDFAQVKARIETLAFSPDSATLAWADADGKVHLWDVKRRKRGHTYAVHSKRIRTLVWAPKERIIATGAEDGVVRLWEPDTDRILHTLTGFHDRVVALAFSPDGKPLATADGWGDVRLWDPTTGKQLRRLHGPTSPLLSLTWSPDGKRLAGGGELATTHIWDTTNGQVQAVLIGLPTNEALAIGATGHYRCTPGVERDLVYIVQTDKGQETLTPEEFAKKYKWKNDPQLIMTR